MYYLTERLDDTKRSIETVQNQLEGMEQILLKSLQESDQKYKDECITYVLKKIRTSKDVIQGTY